MTISGRRPDCAAPLPPSRRRIADRPTESPTETAIPPETERRERAESPGSLCSRRFCKPRNKNVRRLADALGLAPLGPSWLPVYHGRDEGRQRMFPPFPVFNIVEHIEEHDSQHQQPV